MDQLFDILNNKLNKLNRKITKLKTNLKNKENFKEQMEKDEIIMFIKNIDNLIYLLDLFNSSGNIDLNEFIKNDKEAEDIIKKFLPYMLHYQINIQDQGNV